MEINNLLSLTLYRSQGSGNGSIHKRLFVFVFKTSIGIKMRWGSERQIDSPFVGKQRNGQFSSSHCGCVSWRPSHDTPHQSAALGVRGVTEQLWEASQCDS